MINWFYILVACADETIVATEKGEIIFLAQNIVLIMTDEVSINGAILRALAEQWKRSVGCNLGIIKN